MLDLDKEEYAEMLDGIKMLLMESYSVTCDQAAAVTHACQVKAEELLIDYSPFLTLIHEITCGMREVLDKHLKQVDLEKDAALQMIAEAAVWHAFERVKRHYKNSM